MGVLEFDAPEEGDSLNARG